MHSGDGYTDAVVLEAPEVWWPALGELTEYPLRGARSFLSAVAGRAVPHPVVALDTPPSVELSRLGRSVFLTAQWCASTATTSTSASASASALSLPEAVRVWCPFTAQWRELAIVSDIARCLSQGGGLARATPPSLPSVSALVSQGRLRLAPRAIRSVTASASTTTAAAPSCVERQLAALTERHTQQILGSCQAFLQRWSEGRASVPVHSVLIEGGAGSGKASVLDRVMQCVPAVVHIKRTRRGTQSCFFVMEHRVVDFVDVLAMDVHEAIKIVETVLRPPPLAHVAADAAATTELVCPVMVVALRHVELLWESTNAVATAVAYQMGASLDALCLATPSTVAGSPRRRAAAAVLTLLLSTAADSSRVPLPLLRHLMKLRVSLGATTTAERVACLQCLFPSSAGETPIEPATPSTAVLERVAQTLSHASVAALLDVTADDVRHRAAALGDEGLGACGTGPYRHLFGVEEVVTALERLLVWPLTHLVELERLHVACVKGAILYGPSGSGKTAIMRALAQRLEHGPDTRWTTTVHLVDGLTLVEKEVGRSEKNIAAMFSAARAAAPTVLLLDNLEALAPPRGRQSSETTTSSDRTLSTLLTEMDGVAGHGGRSVFVVACAPSPDFLDPAVRRPGRLDVHLHLHAPTESIVVDAMTAQLARVVQHLCGPHANALGSEDIRNAVRARLVAPEIGLTSSEASAASAALVTGRVRELTLRLIHAAVGEADAPPVDGLPLDTVLRALDTALER